MNVHGVVYLASPFEGNVIGKWDNVFFKIIVLLDVQEIRKKVKSEFSDSMERHLDVVIEILDIQSRFSFEFNLDEELIKYW